MPTHGSLPLQLVLGSQESPAAVPPLQVLPTQVPPAQSHGKPSSDEPAASHTPCATTHVPPGQSSSPLQGFPSGETFPGTEHKNSPVGVGVAWADTRLATPHPSATNKTTSNKRLRSNLLTAGSQHERFFRFFHGVSQQESDRWCPRHAPCTGSRHPNSPGEPSVHDRGQERSGKPLTCGARWATGSSGNVAGSDRQGYGERRRVL